MIIKKEYMIERIDRTTRDVTVFSFKSVDGVKVDFIPGMFAMLFYRDQGTGEEIGRAFSIANAPPSDSFEFMIAMVHGRLTSKLDGARVGDTYRISAPYGALKLDLALGSRFLFIAGGTGIAPFFSMIRYLKANNDKIDVNMLYSVRYPYEIIEKQELDSFGAEGCSVSITVTRPQPGDGWSGQTGHIDAEMIKKCSPDFAERVPYICGPPKFVQAMKEALMSLGVQERAIKAEMWGE